MTRRTIVPLLLALALPAVAAPDPGGRVTLPCGRPAALAVARPLGLADQGAPMERMVLVLERRGRPGPAGAVPGGPSGPGQPGLPPVAHPGPVRGALRPGPGRRGPGHRLARGRGLHGGGAAPGPHVAHLLRHRGPGAAGLHDAHRQLPGEGRRRRATRCRPPSPGTRPGRWWGWSPCTAAAAGPERGIPPGAAGAKRAGPSILAALPRPGDVAAIYNPDRSTGRASTAPAWPSPSSGGPTRPLGDVAAFREAYGLPARTPDDHRQRPGPGRPGWTRTRRRTWTWSGPGPRPRAPTSASWPPAPPPPPTGWTSPPAAVDRNRPRS